jgi:hypothetical protein
MATNSILKTVHIKDARSAGRLADALENSQKRSHKKKSIPIMVTTASNKDIREIFGKADDRN